jgi:hypothetical protein
VKTGPDLHPVRADLKIDAHGNRIKNSKTAFEPVKTRDPGDPSSLGGLGGFFFNKTETPFIFRKKKQNSKRMSCGFKV